MTGNAPSGHRPTPRETTIVAFRHLLQQHGLSTTIFAEIQGVLEEQGLVLKAGTIVDPAMVPAVQPAADLARFRGRAGRGWAQTGREAAAM